MIDIYPPSGLGEPDTEIALYDKDGSTELAKDESGFPGLAGSIDTKTDVEELLSSGTYFIKVYHENPSGGGQPYVVRAISLGLDDTIPPGTPYADGVPAPIPAYDPNADSSYEGANDTPSSTTAVLELDVDWVQRYLSSGTDVDWLKLVLP